MFKRAFYHKSMNNDGRSGTSNERLEYLGDAVLSTIVAEYLFKKYPNRDEGFLTKMRSKIVKRKTLNDIADQMGTGLDSQQLLPGKDVAFDVGKCAGSSGRGGLYRIWLSQN